MLGQKNTCVGVEGDVLVGKEEEEEVTTPHLICHSNLSAKFT